MSTCTTRTMWQDLYGFEAANGTNLAAHLLADPSFAAASDIGIQGTGAALGKFALPLTDHPNFKAPSASIDSEQARGISERHDEEYNTVQTGEAVEFTLPLLGHAYNLAAFLPLLFQAGASEGAGVQAGTKLLTCVPYTTACVDNFGYFTRSVQAVGGGMDIDYKIKGGICTDLTVSGEAGGLLVQEATIKAAKWEEADLSTAATGLTALLDASFDTEQALKYQDSEIAFYNEFNYKAFSDLTFDLAGSTITSAGGGFNQLLLETGDTIEITGTVSNDGTYTCDGAPSDTVITTNEAVADEGTGDAYALITQEAEWQIVYAPSISFTIHNNALFNYYNDDAAASIHLGRMGIEGSITIPFSQSGVGTNYMIRRFLAGEPVKIAWYWGQSSDTADVENDHDLSPTLGPDRYKNDTLQTDPKNYFSIVINAKVVDYDIVGDNELQVECTLAGVTDTGDQAINVFAVYDAAKLIRL